MNVKLISVRTSNLTIQVPKMGGLSNFLTFDTYPTRYEVIRLKQRALLDIELALVEAVLLHHDLSGDLGGLGFAILYSGKRHDDG